MSCQTRSLNIGWLGCMVWLTRQPYVKKSFETDIDDLILETSINEQENYDDNDDDDKTYQIEC